MKGWFLGYIPQRWRLIEVLLIKLGNEKASELNCTVVGLAVAILVTGERGAGRGAVGVGLGTLLPGLM